MKKEKRRLRIGLLGCGPISQAAHLEAIRKARNADLYAICDVAKDLTERIAAIYQPSAVYNDLAPMLADSQVEAVVIAVADQYHVTLARIALAAGKHVLIEKPLGTTVEECESLRLPARASGVTLQIGNNRRFEPGMMAAHRFVRDELGPALTFDTWYYDSVYRYTMQDNLYPVSVESANSRRPAGDWKANRERYLLLTHGAHLVDTARFLVGPIECVSARHRSHGPTHGWSVDVDFANGTLGHLELISPRHDDFKNVSVFTALTAASAAKRLCPGSNTPAWSALETASIDGSLAKMAIRSSGRSRASPTPFFSALHSTEQTSMMALLRCELWWRSRSPSRTDGAWR